jgi:hypothetical protein
MARRVPTQHKYDVVMLIVVRVTARTAPEAIEVATNSKHVWDDWALAPTHTGPEATEVK